MGTMFHLSPSQSIVIARVLSAMRARELSGLNVHAQTLTSLFLSSFARYIDSAVSPDFESTMTTSPSLTAPRSPWTAVFVWRNFASSPRESMVPSNFSHIGTFFPSPVATALCPSLREPQMSEHSASKLSSSSFSIDSLIVFSRVLKYSFKAIPPDSKARCRTRRISSRSRSRRTWSGRARLWHG